MCSIFVIGLSFTLNLDNNSFTLQTYEVLYNNIVLTQNSSLIRGKNLFAQIEKQTIKWVGF